MVEKGKSFRSFEDLECWKACRSVRRFITELVKKYPKEEKYALVDDMKRAARSATHNLAEGFGRFHYQENIQFSRISRGSLYELTLTLHKSLVQKRYARSISGHQETLVHFHDLTVC